MTSYENWKNSTTPYSTNYCGIGRWGNFDQKWSGDQADQLPESEDGIPKEVGFTGGWVGNCKKGREWTYDGDQSPPWACRAGESDVKVNFSNVHGISNRMNGYKASLFINSKNVEKIRENLGLPGSEDMNRVVFRGQCWIGNESTMPVNTGSAVSFDQGLDASGTWINFSLPKRQDPDIKMGQENSWNEDGDLSTLDKVNVNEYSCMWGFLDKQSSAVFGTPGSFDSTPGKSFNVKHSSISPNVKTRSPGSTPSDPDFPAIANHWVNDFTNTQNPIGNSEGGFAWKFCAGGVTLKAPVCSKISAS